MWLFTSSGFVSIVQDRDNKENLLVRARVRSHLQALFPQSKVAETLDSDYRFRCTVTRKSVEKVIAKLVASIDYDNFKNSISQPAYHSACQKVWGVMHGLQAGVTDLRLAASVFSVQNNGQKKPDT